MAKDVPALSLTISWDPASKRFKLTTVLQMEHGVSSHWFWIETTQKIEAPDVTRISEDIRGLLESRIPY